MVGVTASNEQNPRGAIADGDAYQAFLGGSYGNAYPDAFITEFDSAGKRLYGSYIGGEKSEVATGIACNKFGTLYLTGNTGSKFNIPFLWGWTHQWEYGGGGIYVPQAGDTVFSEGDGFLVKLAPFDYKLDNGEFADTACPLERPVSLKFTNNGDVFRLGYFKIYCAYGLDAQNMDTIERLDYQSFISPGATIRVYGGNMNFSVPGTYTIHAWMDHLRSDSSRSNDTITYQMVILDYPSADSIQAIISGADVAFLLDSVEYADSYKWDFGDYATGSGPNPVHRYADNGSYQVTVVVSNVCGHDTLTRMIDMNTVHVSSLEKDEDWVIYPNPANGYLTIEQRDGGALGRIVLLNAVGQVVISEASPGSKKIIHTSGLPNGLYTVLVASEEKNEVFTISIIN